MSVKPDFVTMTTIELRAYVLQHRDDEEAYTSISINSTLRIQVHGYIDLKTA